MRVTLAVPSGMELVNFNICVWDMLRAIQRLASSHSTGDVNTPDSVIFSFVEDEDNKGVYEGKAVFFRWADGVDPYYKSSASWYLAGTQQGKPITPLKLDPPYSSDIVFSPPKGCNLSESAGHVYTEVAKLGYAMTHGRLFPDQIDEPRTGPSFYMVFSYNETPEHTRT